MILITITEMRYKYKKKRIDIFIIGVWSTDKTMELKLNNEK